MKLETPFTHLIVACGLFTLTASEAASHEAASSSRDSPSAGLASIESGNYLLLQQTVTIARVPVLADVIATTRALSIQKLELRGDRLIGDGRLCDLKIESSSDLVKTELPEAFRRALPPPRTDAKLEVRDGRIFFRQAAQTLVLGAKLKSPGEALPTSVDDARVVDSDRDGHPGVTVRVSGFVSGEIRLAQRSTSRLSGVAVDGGFHGRVEFQNEQVVLDATNPLLKNGPTSEPDFARSFFRFEKIPNDAGCDEAKRRARSIH